MISMGLFTVNYVPSISIQHDNEGQNNSKNDQDVSEAQHFIVNLGVFTIYKLQKFTSKECG